ncbi:MAG: hypothetical protein ACO3A4_12755 [Silvanigrellaceae bacterium]
MSLRLNLIFLTLTSISGIALAQRNSSTSQFAPLAEAKKSAAAQTSAVALDVPTLPVQNSQSGSQDHSANVGLGIGMGFIPHPTVRFDLDLLFNQPHVLTVSFEASTFSNNHFIAKSLLVNNYERDVKRRRLSVMYRNSFTSSLYYTFGLGFENYSANLLAPATEYSQDYKSVVTGIRQGYTVTTGLGQSFHSGPVLFRIEWVGFSFLRLSKDITYFNADSSEGAAAKLADSKAKLKADTAESIRLMNITLSYEF